MILSYMDEAGGVSYARAEKSRLFLRSAVLVPDDSLGIVEGLIDAILDTVPKKRGSRPTFHAFKIFHATRESGWEFYTENCRRELLNNMADLLEMMDLHFVYACLDKVGMTVKYTKPANPHILSFIQVGEMVERWMASHHRAQFWAPCVGKSDYDREIERIFVCCRESGPPYGRAAERWSYAADVIAFTSPATSKLFLLADLCAFVASRKQHRKEDWGLHERIRGRLFCNRRYPREPLRGWEESTSTAP